MPMVQSLAVGAGPTSGTGPSNSAGLLGMTSGFHQKEYVAYMICAVKQPCTLFSHPLVLYNAKHAHVRCIPITEMQAVNVTRQMGQTGYTGKAGLP